MIDTKKIKNPKITYPQRRVFIIDQMALIFAYFVSLLIRFNKDFTNWSVYSDGLYISLLVVLVLAQALIFAAYDARRPSLFEQGRIQNLVMIIKGRMILLLFVISYLYVLQESNRASRFIVPFTIALDVLFDFLLRGLIRKHYMITVRPMERVIYAIRPPFPDDEQLTQQLEELVGDSVLIYQGDAGDAELRRVVSVCEEAGTHPYVALKVLGHNVRGGIVSDIAGHASVPMAIRPHRFKVFGVNYAVARVEEAVVHVIRHISELSGQYICFSNVHTTVMARENPEYREVLNQAAFTFPDGNPIASLEQKFGFERAERVAGPDFMHNMFKATKDGGLSHYFYGSSQETLDALKEKLEKKYPNMDIRGMYSPPFRPLTEEEDKEVVERINASGADIIWIGLGAPKQEKWMNAHKGKINGVMMGVGAGFDFHAGTIKRAPVWIQGIGFEWLYRLFQDPKRLIRRYLVTNVKFFWYLIFSGKENN